MYKEVVKISLIWNTSNKCIVNEKKIDRIKRIAKGVGSESGLKAIKDLCPSDYTYEEIKLVLIDINKAKQ